MPRRPHDDKALIPTGSQSKLGTCSTNSPMLLAPNSLSLESLRVVMAIGTSCAFSARLRAVTTISSSPPPSALSWAYARSDTTAPQDNTIPKNSRRLFFQLIRVREPLSMTPPHLTNVGPVSLYPIVSGPECDAMPMERDGVSFR